jgi:hypothetical protein
VSELLLFRKTATLFDRAAFRGLSSRIDTGVVITMGYRRNRGKGAVPALEWNFVDVLVNGAKVWRTGRGLPIFRRSRRAVACMPGVVDIHVREGLPGRPQSQLDSASFEVEQGEVLHIKIVPDLNGVFGGRISCHGIRVIQRSQNGSLVPVAKPQREHGAASRGRVDRSRELDE